MNLFTVRHSLGTEVQSTDTTLGDLYKHQYGDVPFGDKWCIRMGSTHMTGTGAYYLNLFFKEKIPNYDYRKIEKIL